MCHRLLELSKTSVARNVKEGGEFHSEETIKVDWVNIMMDCNENRH